ncbi:MAG: hypothetical protein H7239_01220 [Flavobacterium sp.]|nr:hypothetical protein [Flavobacterium sp.]
MVTISETSENFIFKLKGLHFIWALKHELRIPKKNIVKVYQNAEELNKWKGFRFGTYVPGLITAGTFSWKGTTNFWDVCNRKNTIIIELKDSIYNKLYLEVTDVSNATKILTQK